MKMLYVVLAKRRGFSQVLQEASKTIEEAKKSALRHAEDNGAVDSRGLQWVENSEASSDLGWAYELYPVVVNE